MGDAGDEDGAKGAGSRSPVLRLTQVEGPGHGEHAYYLLSGQYLDIHDHAIQMPRV